VAPSSAKGTGILLAGRKLLLADDSVTIQKVIDLTFADEGVEVITVGDGTDAIEKVEQLLPDVVLADIFMPGFNGYEVCEYIKGSEKLKHIPVMLLVGSFEPFDEVEARRVGANDTLTKPFQSIRRLIEKVGDLVGGKSPETETDTAELPKQEQQEAPRLSTAELEITTADTLQLPPDLAHKAHEFAKEAAATAPAVIQNKAESQTSEVKRTMVTEPAETPLDLDYYEPAQAVEADDFELELELDEPETAPEPAYAAPGYFQPQVSPPPIVAWEETGSVALAHPPQVLAPPEPVMEAGAAEPQFERSYAPLRAAVVGAAVESRGAQGPLTASDLSPELIDVIAHRAVEMLSEKVVREIAWEVVPQLAELLIKRRLEERESQHK
jgi:CheY-like chemotaxis protein